MKAASVIDMVLLRTVNGLRSLMMENGHDQTLADQLTYEVEATDDGVVVRLPHLKPSKKAKSSRKITDGSVGAVVTPDDLEDADVVGIEDDGSGVG